MKMNEKMLRTHLYVLGESGTGKSRALLTWIIQIIKAGYGLCLIDPTGTLFADVVAHIARADKSYWRRTVIIDPTDSHYCVAINPLQVRDGEEPSERAEKLARMVIKIYQDDPLITARLNRIMKHTFWLLIELELTLAEFGDLLVDMDFLMRQLDKLPAHHELRRYFQLEFPNNSFGKRSDWTQSSLNRVDNMMKNPKTKCIFGQKKPTINFSQLMDEDAIVLVNTSKGGTTEEMSYLFGGFIVAELQEAAQARAERRYQDHKLYVACIDEFQNYVTDDIETVLSETRKYGLGAILSHQFMAQLSDNSKLLSAVLGTVQNYVTFRVGREDAEKLSKTMFSPQVDQIKDMRRVMKPTNFNFYVEEYEPIYRPLEESWEFATRALQLQSSREFWFKSKGVSNAVKHRSHYMPELRPDKRLKRRINKLSTFSAQKHGRLKEDVLAEIDQRRQKLLVDFYEHDAGDQ